MRCLRPGTFLLVLLASVGCQQPDPDATGEPVRSKPAVLVTGATGTQGGAVVRELLRRDYRVRGLTRDPDQPAALRLQELGAEVVAGDYGDPESLLAAMDGVQGVFAMTVWGEGIDDEVAQGRALIEAARANDIGHFVFSSVAGADQATGLAHFESKYAIEQLLAESGLTYSVVRPVEFMNNWRYMLEDIRAGRYVNPRDPEDRHQWIAARDIGFFVAEAFDDRSAWAGRVLEIAGDEMTLRELVAVMSDVFDRPVEYVQADWGDMERSMGPEMTDMYRWFADEGYNVDVAGLRQAYPGLMTVREYLARLAAPTAVSETDAGNRR